MKGQVLTAIVCAVGVSAAHVASAIAQEQAPPAQTAPAQPAPVETAPTPAPPAEPAEPEPAPKTKRLSDERSLSRWAHPAWPSRIRSDHRRNARTVGKLRFFTEDGFPEVYLALRSYTDTKEREWVEIRVPKRPNGITGWVPRESLGDLNVNRFRLVIDRRTLRAKLYRRGRLIFSAPVGVGTATNRTPAGRFYVREKFRFDNLPMYGTRAIGTSAYAPRLSEWPGGGVVGLHGTSQPQLIPGRPSHGCVRLRNPDIGKLWRLVPIGTPIRIL